VHIVWGYHHMDWCFLGSRGTFGGILLMWDKRVVEKIECVGAFLLLALLEA
jgi:hypothetical protein